MANKISLELEELAKSIVLDICKRDSASGKIECRMSGNASGSVDVTRIYTFQDFCSEGHASYDNKIEAGNEAMDDAFSNLRFYVEKYIKARSEVDGSGKFKFSKE